MISPLQQQQHQSQHQHQHEQQRHSQPFCAPPPCSPSSIVAERARAAAHDALARCSYAGAAFFAEQIASLPGEILISRLAVMHLLEVKRNEDEKETKLIHETPISSLSIER